MASSLFMTEDSRVARLLADEKITFREAEAKASALQFEGLRAGRLDDAQRGALHLDLLRDMKLVTPLRVQQVNVVANATE